MTDLAGAIQIAIFEKLAAVEGLPQVKSEVPTTVDGDQEIVAYPFVLLGDDQVTEIGTKDGRVEQHEVTIHVCFQNANKLDVRAAQELVRAALHDQPLTAEGAIFSRPQATGQNTPLLDDGATYVGNQPFLIIAQAAD